MHLQAAHIVSFGLHVENEAFISHHTWFYGPKNVYLDQVKDGQSRSDLPAEGDKDPKIHSLDLTDTLSEDADDDTEQSWLRTCVLAPIREDHPRRRGSDLEAWLDEYERKHDAAALSEMSAEDFWAAQDDKKLASKHFMPRLQVLVVAARPLTTSKTRKPRL